jgi:hypothetical protein
MSDESPRIRPFAPVMAGARHRIQPYLEPDVYPRFREYCVSKRATESAVVNAALRMLFGEESDTARLFKRLDRMSRTDERVERDLALLGQSFAAFLQYWFAVTPLPSADVEKARVLSRSRFQSFTGYVADQFARGNRFLSDLAERALGSDSDVHGDRETAGGTMLDITGDPKENGE